MKDRKSATNRTWAFAHWNDGFKEFYLNSNRCFHFYTQYSIIPLLQHSSGKLDVVVVK